jgi:hypothetical protein
VREFPAAQGIALAIEVLPRNGGNAPTLNAAPRHINITAQVWLQNAHS